MSTGTITPSPYQQEIGYDVSGLFGPISGALIYTYAAGTSTPIATWTTVNVSGGSAVPNTNPIVANSSGRWVAFLAPGVSYKFVLCLPVTPIPPPSSPPSNYLTADDITAVPAAAQALVVTGILGESVVAPQLIYLSNGSGGKIAGRWYLGDSTNTYSSTTPEMGYAGASGSAGDTIAIQQGGQITGLSGLSAGLSYYASTAGTITAVAPTNARFVGQADSTTTLIFGANPPPPGPFSAVTLTNHGIVLGRGVGTVGATAVMTTGQLLVGVTGADPVPTTASAAGASMTLLKAGSGTSTAVGATNVDTIAITGLTAGDMLLVKVIAISTTAATANIGLFNSTDGVALNTAVASLAGDATMMVNFDSSQAQASATSFVTYAKGKDTVPTLYDTLVVAAMTQAWTGSWTLALRHGGVTATGTFRWRWSVFKLSGQ